MQGIFESYSFDQFYFWPSSVGAVMSVVNQTATILRTFFWVHSILFALLCCRTNITGHWRRKEGNSLHCKTMFKYRTRNLIAEFQSCPRVSRMYSVPIVPKARGNILRPQLFYSYPLCSRVGFLLTQLDPFHFALWL